MKYQETSGSAPVRAVCVGRHPFLSSHLKQFFGAMGLDTIATVGIEGALLAAQALRPDLVICDYDLLATTPLAPWEESAHLADVPVIAVSLTRRPEEVHLLDINGIGGFLYLPTLTPDKMRSVLSAVLPVRARQGLASLHVSAAVRR